MILDELNEQLTYWPISGLIEGDASSVLTFTVENTPVAGALTATQDTRLKVWCRKAGVGSYVDISAGSIDLSVLSGDIDFEIYIEVVGDIEGLERIPTTVTAGLSEPAGWVAT